MGKESCQTFCPNGIYQRKNSDHITHDICEENRTMNRSDLITRLADMHPQLQAKDVTLAVTLILNTMSATLANGDRIEVRGFGSFSLNYRPPRISRNPKTGARVDVPAKYQPHFKPGKELRWRVDRDAAKSSF